MNIYLDIDGVLLQKSGIIADNFDDFIEFVVLNYDVFWLTTHCKNGENRAIEHIIRDNSLSEKTLKLLQKIKPTNWQTLKTEAIDFSKNFIWLDDYLMESEANILKENNTSEKIIIVDLRENPSILINIANFLKNNG